MHKELIYFSIVLTQFATGLERASHISTLHTASDHNHDYIPSSVNENQPGVLSKHFFNIY